MYIRRTQTRNTTTGERYFTHRLVRSERLGGKVRQVTLLNLGRHFAVAQADWPTLCARLEELLSGQEALLGGYGGLLVEREAQRLAALLLARQGSLVMGSMASSSTSVPMRSARRGNACNDARRLRGHQAHRWRCPRRLVIAILVEALQGAEVLMSAALVASRLTARAVAVTTAQVEQVFARYGLTPGKKTLA